MGHRIDMWVFNFCMNLFLWAKYYQKVKITKFKHASMPGHPRIYLHVCCKTCVRNFVCYLKKRTPSSVGKSFPSVPPYEAETSYNWAETIEKSINGVTHYWACVCFRHLSHISDFLKLLRPLWRSQHYRNETDGLICSTKKSQLS